MPPVLRCWPLPSTFVAHHTLCREDDSLVEFSLTKPACSRGCRRGRRGSRYWRTKKTRRLSIRASNGSTNIQRTFMCVAHVRLEGQIGLSFSRSSTSSLALKGTRKGSKGHLLYVTRRFFSIRRVLILVPATLFPELASLSECSLPH